MNAQAQPAERGTAPEAVQPQVIGPPVACLEEVLNAPALALLSSLHRRFEARRQELLALRALRQAQFDAGELPAFLSETRRVRLAEWAISPVPPDLRDRRLEITGPAERKMIINALNAPVSAFMADFEDACSPTWENIIGGQLALSEAVRGTLRYTDPLSGRDYRLGEHTATLLVRPRGWHLPEKHVRFDGSPVSAALFDCAVFLANNAAALVGKGTGPYFYLPKLQSHLEARLWNDVFLTAEDALGLPAGTIRATVLIETLPAAFEMDEILYELREHAAGLNCGRWDYIFSFIKTFRNRPEFLLPDRASVTMDSHCMRSYVDLLIKTCHRRGAHAMGGMAAQIPIRDDAAANQLALARVRADKLREARAGHDGTWIAHPGLAQVAREPFDAIMRGPNQLHVLRSEVQVTREDLLRVPEGAITEAGVRGCIRVGVQYLEACLRGVGCVPLYHLMEDAATAEICRAQLWQWVRHGARTNDGQRLTPERFEGLLTEELDRIHDEVGRARLQGGLFPTATRLFEELIQRDTFEEFLTLAAYELLA